MKPIRNMCLLFMFATNLVWAQDSVIRIISYNTLHGFRDDKAIRQQYIAWIRDQHPDIVFYEEMNGYNQQRVRELAASYGHPYSVILNQESGFDVTHPIAISSRLPIEDCHMYLDSMWHGYIYARIGGIHCFVTHMAPFTLKDRQKDMARIVAQASALDPSLPILIAGDLNSLAVSDSLQYGHALLVSMRKTEGRLEPKSGTPIVKNKIIYRNNLNNGQLDYSVTNLIADAGFLDSYHVLNKTFKNSVPTKSMQKKKSILRRIDYIWVNPTLAARLVRADILQDQSTDVLSDHYPVLIDIKQTKQPYTVFAHRGFRGLNPENTITAMKTALDYGAVLEMDLAISHDKKVIVSHDPMLSPIISLDPNGQPIPKKHRPVLFQMDYADIQKYDVGSKPNPAFSTQGRYQAHVPLLSELIDSTLAYAHEKGYPAPRYFIETKTKPETDLKQHPAPEEFVDLMMQVLKSRNIEQQVIIQSFDPRTLQVLKKKYPQMKLALLARKGSGFDENITWLGFHPDYYSADPEDINTELATNCKSLGIRIIVGNTNDQEEIKRIAKLGVLDFMSDFPLRQH